MIDGTLAQIINELVRLTSVAQKAATDLEERTNQVNSYATKLAKAESALDAAQGEINELTATITEMELDQMEKGLTYEVVEGEVVNGTQPSDQPG